MTPLKSWKEGGKNLSPQNPIPLKISFYQKLREFITNRPALQNMFLKSSLVIRNTMSERNLIVHNEITSPAMIKIKANVKGIFLILTALKDNWLILK